MAFWLGLVLVLLPRDKTPESEKAPQISASEAVLAATAAVSDASQFCKRQPAACEVGGQAATVIGQRASEGARQLYQIITDKKSPERTAPPERPVDKKPPERSGDKSDNKKAPDHTGSIGDVADADVARAVEATRDTLTADDLAVEWHAPPMP